MTQNTHGITAEEFARVEAKVYEPTLDWDKPDEYDLLDRTNLTEWADKILAALAWAGYVVQRQDDLCLDEMEDPKPSETQCTASHPMIDNGAQCRYLDGHLTADLPHTTLNGMYWYTVSEPSDSGSES